MSSVERRAVHHSSRAAGTLAEDREEDIQLWSVLLYSHRSKRVNVRIVCVAFGEAVVCQETTYS